MPWSNMNEVPSSIKALAAVPGGGDKILLTLAQANEIGRMVDGMKGKEEIDNPFAIAITNFRRMYRVQSGRWLKRKKEELSEQPGTTTFSSLIALEVLAESEDERLRGARTIRSKKYGISVVAGKTLQKPKEYADIPENRFGDPVNWSYPIDSAHIGPAVGYFNHSGQRAAGGYSEDDWTKIGNRIAKAAGEGYSYNSEKEIIATPVAKKQEKKTASEVTTRIVKVEFKEMSRTFIIS